MSDSLEIMVERDQLQQIIKLSESVALVGRGVDCNVRIEDPLASRHHLRLEIQGERVCVVDLDSRNGTWINGKRIDRAFLSREDKIKIGSTEISLHGGIHLRLDSLESTRTQHISREEQSIALVMSLLLTFSYENRRNQIVAAVIDAAIEICNAERGFVFLLNKKKVSYSLARNFAHETVPSPEKKFSQTLIEKAAASNGPILIEDAASDGQFAGVESVVGLGLRSIVAIALKRDDHLFGVLAVDHRLTGGAFGGYESNMLQLLAQIVSSKFAITDLEARLQKLEKSLKENSTASLTSSVLEDRERFPFEEIIGKDPSMVALFEEMSKVIDSPASVVIEGESGTGKELVARALHFSSLNGDNPFVAENCGAIHENLLESELFGHVKGAFTGASHDRVGRFVEARNGTLFLDEVAEMSPSMQAKLLRVLQEGEVRPVGSNKVVKVSARLLAATHHNLFDLVSRGEFREDLYYRLNVITLRVPALRERISDIPLLANYLMRKHSEKNSQEVRPFSALAMKQLCNYSWPGNVRELENEIQRLCMLDRGEVQLEELSAPILAAEASTSDNFKNLSLPERVASLEKTEIHKALQKAKGNKTEAAKSLGLSRYALVRKLAKYDLDGSV